MIRVRKLLLAHALLLLAACSNAPAGRTRIDGGAYVVGDSGLRFDARVLWRADAEPVDSGPFQCGSTCAPDEVCSCLDTKPRPSCGCHPRQGYNAACDPQVPTSCRDRLTCGRARRIDGVFYLCSDGREGSACSPAESVCNTSNGCVCLSTPLGTGCSCRGEIGENPELCDPNVPASCPNGTCIRVQSRSSATYFCSTGARFEPCDPANPTCTTSLGCLCPVVSSQSACQCVEPGAVGEPCDLRVTESCQAGLSCVLVSDGLDTFDSRCANRGQLGDGGLLIDECSDAMPCPPPLVCTEIRPGVRQCAPDR